MSQAKPSAIPQSSNVVKLSSDNQCERDLQLQLQKELDRLALLIQEVKRQSAIVQAAADAIGDRLLSERLQDISFYASPNDDASLLKATARKKESASYSKRHIHS